MMNSLLFLILLFGLQTLCLVIGGRFLNSSKTAQDYFLAGKGIGFFPLMMTFLATQVGGGIILGSAEEAYRYGWAVLLFPLGSALGLLLLSVGAGSRIARFPVTTIAQIFEVAYHSVRLKKIASGLSIVSLFLIFVAQIIASKQFWLGLGFDDGWLFVLLWAIVIVYTVVGGFKAVVATDVIQAAFFVIVFVCCFIYSVVVNEWPSVVTIDPTAQSYTLSFNTLVGWLLMPLLFMLIEQDMGQRCFAAKRPRVVSQATFCAGVVTMAICAIPVYFGILGQRYNVIAPPGSSILLATVQTVTNPTVATFVACAILAAIISTADSLLSAIASNLVQDIGPSFSRRRMPQVLTCGIGFIGVVVSVGFSNVVDLLVQAYELSICCLFVPIVMALYRGRGPALAATLAITCGACSYVVLRVWPLSCPSAVISVCLSAFGYGVGALLSKKREVAYE